MNHYEHPKHPEAFVTNLELDVEGLKIPITFEINEKGYFNFRNNDYEEEFAIDGMISKKIARINHIYVPNKLRGKGLGAVLLKGLENQLAQCSVHTALPTFSKTATIEFFLHHDYKVAPISTLSSDEYKDLYMDREPFNDWIQDENDYNILKLRDKKQLYKKILLSKNIEENGRE